MVVGEAPGTTENDEGVPFVGKAGQYLRASIPVFWAGPIEDVYITNVVKCWPPAPEGKGNRTPAPQEIKMCRQWFELELKTKKPLLIVPLGNTALEAVTGSEGISTKHGQIAWESKHSTYVYPMYHPSYILRQHDEELSSVFHRDCARLGQVLNRPWAEVELWLRDKVREQ